uniref:MFS domain-containing protein n=1 Tax=Caenorhabditis japonica TaxID=281687 RepID=A0A8R1ENS7_CAEJA
MIEDQGKVVFICLITVLFSILPVGYHMAMLNVPEKVIQQFIFQNFENIFGLKLSPAQESLVWSLTVSSQGVGALIGCLLVGPMAKFGAKHVLMGLNNVILIAGSLLMFLSYWMSFPIAFILGRILTGVYTGLACAFAPLYLQQVISKKHKRIDELFLHIAVCFGSSLGAIFSLPFMFGSDTTWPTLVIFPAFSVSQFWWHLFGFPTLQTTCCRREGTRKQFKASSRLYLTFEGLGKLKENFYRFYYDIEDSDEDEIIKEYWDMVPEMPEQLTICA